MLMYSKPEQWEWTCTRAAQARWRAAADGNEWARSMRCGDVQSYIVHIYCLIRPVILRKESAHIVYHKIRA